MSSGPTTKNYSKNIEGVEAERVLADPHVFVLDVRTPHEHEALHLERSVLIPVDQLAGRLDELPDDKSKPIIVYCAHGVRSVYAMSLLEQAGYTHVQNLLGGIAHYAQYISQRP